MPAWFSSVPRPATIRLMGSQIGGQGADGILRRPGRPRLSRAKIKASRCCRAPPTGLDIPFWSRASASARRLAGMRFVGSADELMEAIAAAKREAASSFGNDQILIGEIRCQTEAHRSAGCSATTTATWCRLFERECTLQRRHQKVVGGSALYQHPPPNGARRMSCGGTLRRAEPRGILGPVRSSSSRIHPVFYFIEMNTRLAGRASGHRNGHRPRPGRVACCASPWAKSCRWGRTISQPTATPSRHAFIAEEIPRRDFCRRAGTNPRVARARRARASESMPVSGPADDITPYYDALLAKLIAWGADRARRALRSHRRGLGRV